MVDKLKAISDMAAQMSDDVQRCKGNPEIADLLVEIGEDAGDILTLMGYDSAVILCGAPPNRNDE